MEQSKEYHDLIVYMERSSRELKQIRELLITVTAFMRNAETEVPERNRRFVTYMHDLHDIIYMYESRGLDVPSYVHREMERCDDRFRQLYTEANTDGGWGEKLRREMAADPLNRWDHTRELPKPKEKADDTRTSEQGREGKLEGRAQANGNLTGGGEPAGQHGGSGNSV